MSIIVALGRDETLHGILKEAMLLVVAKWNRQHRSSDWLATFHVGEERLRIFPESEKSNDIAVLNIRNL
jgi:hypothetical protein